MGSTRDRSLRSLSGMNVTVRVNEPRVGAYLNTESQVFARYALDSQIRQLELAKPTLTVRAVEVGSGEPALFLHGFGLCAAHWAPLLARLPSLHSVAIDMPGHGGTGGIDFRGENLREWFREMLTSCLDKLGLESAHIVGHSQGGMIGMWLAIDAPERVRSLVVIGVPAVAFGGRMAAFRLLARPGIGPLLFRIPKPAFAYRRILAGTMGQHAVDAYPDLVRATYLATRRSDHGPTVSTYLREMYAGVDARPARYVLDDAELARIDRPPLIVWGREDVDFQPIADAQSRVALIPNARFEVVRGGHEPWLDDADVCANLLSGFQSTSGPSV